MFYGEIATNTEVVVLSGDNNKCASIFVAFGL